MPSQPRFYMWGGCVRPNNHTSNVHCHGHNLCTPVQGGGCCHALQGRAWPARYCHHQAGPPNSLVAAARMCAGLPAAIHRGGVRARPGGQDTLVHGRAHDAVYDVAAGQRAASGAIGHQGRRHRVPGRTVGPARAHVGGCGASVVARLPRAPPGSHRGGVPGVGGVCGAGGAAAHHATAHLPPRGGGGGEQQGNPGGSALAPTIAGHHSHGASQPHALPGPVQLHVGTRGVPPGLAEGGGVGAASGAALLCRQLRCAHGAPSCCGLRHAGVVCSRAGGHVTATHIDRLPDQHAA
mmetsp:Transcript_19164/g.48696  ORF Transcript_19164/g.48696 Transcript_19164/m.48696 type:complete len:294 (+) Transcript_19164:1995-2876(+)